MTENDTSAVVLASAGPTTLDVSAAPVIVAPRLASRGLSGLTTGAPRLAFTSIAGAGTLTSIKVTLPAGLGSRANAVLSKYLTVSAGKKSIKHTVTHSGRTITITLKQSVASVTVLISAKGLSETAALEKAVKAGHTKKLSVPFTLTNTKGGVKKTTASLKV